MFIATAPFVTVRRLNKVDLGRETRNYKGAKEKALNSTYCLEVKHFKVFSREFFKIVQGHALNNRFQIPGKIFVELNLKKN